jgi:hypothetical protein
MDVTIRTEILIHVQAVQGSTGPWLHAFSQSWISTVLSEASSVHVDGYLQRAKPAGPTTGCCFICELRCRPGLCAPFVAAWTRKSETGKPHFLSCRCASAFYVVVDVKWELANRPNLRKLWFESDSKMCMEISNRPNLRKLWFESDSKLCMGDFENVRVRLEAKLNQAILPSRHSEPAVFVSVFRARIWWMSLMMRTRTEPTCDSCYARFFALFGRCSFSCNWQGWARSCRICAVCGQSVAVYLRYKLAKLEWACCTPADKRGHMSYAVVRLGCDD